MITTIRNNQVQLTLDTEGKLILITVRTVICQDGADAPEDPLARAQHFADPTNMYGTPLTVQFSYGQEGDPETLADDILKVLGY